MSCPEVKELLFGELKEPERSVLMAHVSGCEACTIEYERLQATTAALGLVADQEPPVRIRFVSDRVFEQRWWQRVLGGGAIWANAGLALATCLAVAVLIWFQTSRTATPGPPVLSAAEVQKIIDARVGQAVAVAVAENDRRHDSEMKTMLASYERDRAKQQQQLIQQIAAAWQLDDQIKTRALYAAIEKQPSVGQ